MAPFLPSMAADRTTAPSTSPIRRYTMAHRGSCSCDHRMRARHGALRSRSAIIPRARACFNARDFRFAGWATTAVAFYDHRDNPGIDDAGRSRMLRCRSTAANTWHRISASAASPRTPPSRPLTPAGYMLGDYQGVARAHRTLRCRRFLSGSIRGPATPTRSPARVTVARVTDAKAESTGDTDTDILWQNNHDRDALIWLHV